MSSAPIAQVSMTIAAPPERVWEALTQPEQVRQYLFGTELDTDWQVGSPIRYRGVWQGKPYEDKGEVLEVVPGRRLVSSYYSAIAGLPDSPENYKTVRYELEPAGAGTRLTIVQENNASEDEARHSEENWKMVLEGLKKMVEAG